MRVSEITGMGAAYEIAIKYLEKLPQFDPRWSTDTANNWIRAAHMILSEARKFEGTLILPKE